MALNFRKRIRITKGVRLNLSKSGVSASGKVGPLTLNSRGRTSTALGNGLSYRTTMRSSKKATSTAPQSETAQPPVTGPHYVTVAAPAEASRSYRRYRTAAIVFGCIGLVALVPAWPLGLLLLFLAAMVWRTARAHLIGATRRAMLDADTPAAPETSPAP
jgi:hypothetical protein